VFSERHEISHAHAKVVRKSRGESPPGAPGQRG
jgi:hypothetical protein